MREKWSSRSAFILAAIGSAVGLGNAWRFPGLAAKYGGGAFLFVYLIAMLVIGIPLLMMLLATDSGPRLVVSTQNLANMIDPMTITVR